MPTNHEGNKSPGAPKKPPKPRRLFSFDSVKSAASSDFDESALRGPRPMNPFDLSNVHEKDGERDELLDPFNLNAGVRDSEPWILADDQPQPLRSPPLASPPLETRRSSSRLEPVRPASIETTKSGPAQYATIPTNRLWENLRHHVLTPPIRPATPPSSTVSHASTPNTVRSTTPKPSRLAKFGFKHIVEGARVIQDDTRRFGEEILRACSIARHGELLRSAKDPSTTSLTSNGATGAMAAGAKRLDYLRRPVSVASLSNPSALQSGGGASLRYLYQILLYHAGVVSDAHATQQLSANLPHEPRVLSTLLCPFLTPSRYPMSRLEEEKLTAVDAFELLAKSWIPIDESAVVERCLWCTRAASSMSPHSTRTRILGSLWRILVPTDRPKTVLSSQGFQSLSSGLILLLVALYTSGVPHGAVFGGHAAAPSNNQTYHPDVVLLKEVVQLFLGGSLGDLDDDSVEEEYGAEHSSLDLKDTNSVRRAVFIDALVNCLENSPASSMILLEKVVAEYWLPNTKDTFTDLQAGICNRRINTFCRLALTHIHPFITTLTAPDYPPTPLSPRMNPSASSSTVDTLETSADGARSISLIVYILESRIIPDCELLDVETNLDDQVVLQTRIHVVRVLLGILCLNDKAAVTRMASPGEDVFSDAFGIRTGTGEFSSKQSIAWAIGMLAGWYRAGVAFPWREVLENTLRQGITGGWQTIVPILSALLKQLPDDTKKAVFATIMPIINDQLVEDPPPFPSPEISSLLASISRALPPIFYKPLFACAYSDQEVIVVNHLCTIQVHAKFVKDYWIRDIEMLCVALLSDVGMSDIKSKDGKWGISRLGQMVLLVELIGKIQTIRIDREAQGSGSDIKFIDVIRFITALETRVWQTIEAREAKLLMPSSQRMLFCLLFRELRLFTRSLKPALWLSRAFQWFDVFCADEHIGDLEQEVTDSVQRVQGLYMAAQEGVQQSHKRHTTMLATSVLKAAPVEVSEHERLDLAATFVEHRKLIDSLSKGYISRAMKLFVTMSTLISTDDYRRLGPMLWQHCLIDNADLSATASACFLVMQCSEKTPDDLLPAIEIDVHASDDLTRLEAVRKVAILVNWRFQITTQNFLTDRAHRPFKLGRPPLPFIATDIGSSLYVHVEDINQNKDSDQVPLELKKRLAELGWVEEDANGEDPRHELIQTPLSILPPNQMDRMEVGTVDVYSSPLSPPSPVGSPRRPRPQKEHSQQLLQPIDDVSALLRRNSSSGGPSSGIKRRPVFVPTLSLIFRHLATLVFDSNFTISSAARKALLDLMRNDPALLTRSTLDFLAGESKNMELAISTFSSLLHVKRVLPPPLTHYIFNNLAGFLKQIAKDVEASEALDDFAQVIPILTDLAIQVSGMSVREVRRSKMEHIFIPSGSLWFQSSAPKGPMFPRNAGDTNNPFEPLPTRLLPITMIRVSQNLFFLAMLKRNYKDVQAIRKNMSRLVLPSLDDYGHVKNLELKDFVPRRVSLRHRSSLPRDNMVDILSLMVARSYILLVAQIFRSMPRHLSDKHELAVLVDGLNRCLLAHDDDINIISQVLIALMVASTRFRRMFMNGGGYTLFIPTLVKIYTEKPSHPGIRAAIEYAIGRFYALHKEAFLYQCINIIGQIAMLPNNEVSWFSKGVFDMFASLRKGTTNPAADMAGIHDVNRAEEREALILHTADETPQTFLSSIRRGDSQSNYQVSFELPDVFESARLGMDNFVRLFLTVIAHDLTISRAQHFLRLLRLLSSHLYNASGSSRNVLSDGITALGLIFVKAFAKPKGGGELPKPPLEDEDKTFFSATPGLGNLSDEKTRMPADSKAMRLDFLLLVLAFGQSGGQVSLLTSRQAIDVAKSLLKDWPEGVDILATFLKDFVKMLLHREHTPTAKGVVAFLEELAPIFHAFMMVDFSGVLESILRLMQIPLYNHDVAFSQVIVDEICTAGLAACDLSISENQLMRLPYRPTLISLLAEAIFLREVDIIGEIDKRPPTHHFLAGIVLPLTLAMQTNAQVISDSTRTEAHCIALTNAWVRLLFYAMAACQKSRRDDDDVRNAFKGITGSFRTKSSGARKQEGSFWRSHLPTFMVALQIIKVIVVRGADDISAQPRVGIWERLGMFFRTMLNEGSADFALRPDPASAAGTPTTSPRASTQLDPSNSGFNLFVSTSSDLNQHSSSSTSISLNHTRKSLFRPRLIDYSLWSMLEFVCTYRSPLRMQLKLLIMEKLLSLDQELGQRIRMPNSSFSISPIPNSASSRRLSASIGSRSRQRASAYLPSPESSPHLPATTSGLSPSPTNLLLSASSSQSLSPNLQLPPIISLSPSMLDIPVTNARRPGYAISPLTPQDRRPGRPKIVHLGPTSPALTSSTSPLIGAGLRRYSRAASPSHRESRAESTVSTTKETKVKSAHLIKETYRRIRGVQVFMGFAALLPLSGSMHPTDEEREMAALEAWTKAQALTSVTQETQDLMEEFEETFAPGEESIMVDVEPATPLSPAV